MTDNRSNAIVNNRRPSSVLEDVDYIGLSDDRGNAEEHQFTPLVQHDTTMNFSKTRMYHVCLIFLTGGVILAWYLLFFHFKPFTFNGFTSALSKEDGPYKDTRVYQKTAPYKLASDPNWSFGDHINQSSYRVSNDENWAVPSTINLVGRFKDTLEQLEHNNVDPKHSNVMKGFMLDNDESEEMHNEFKRNKDFLETRGAFMTGDKDYFEKQSSTANSTLFSPHTTIFTTEGYNQWQRDEDLCRKVGKIRDFDPHKCLGAPYLYVTFHGGKSDKKRIKTVCKFTRDGCSLGSALAPSELHSPHSLRGMIHHYNFLFVAEAWKENSQILRYSRCNPDLGHRRELLQILVDANNDPKASGMIHPYGFSKKAGDPYLYVSVQGTNSVLRFRKDNGQPGDLPQAVEIEKSSSYTISKNNDLNKKQEEMVDNSLRSGNAEKTRKHLRDNPIYNGTFVSLGQDEIRGIAFDDQGLLYVADKQKGVLVFDSNGFYLDNLPGKIPTPISIHYCSERNSLWVGSAAKHKLYEYDTSTWELLQTIKHSKLQHPAGFVAHGDSLYVVSQAKGQLLRFSMMTGRLEDVVLPNLLDAGERVLLSSC